MVEEAEKGSRRREALYRHMAAFHAGNGEGKSPAPAPAPAAPPPRPAPLPTLPAVPGKEA